MQEFNSDLRARNTSDLKIHGDQGRQTLKKSFGLSGSFIVLIKIIPIYPRLDFRRINKMIWCKQWKNHTKLLKKRETAPV